jgi:hypothetical protein
MTAPSDAAPITVSKFEAEVEKAYERSENHGTEVFVRITGWMVAAGVAGALLCLNAALDRKICDWNSARSIALLFLVSSVLAVGAQVFSAVGRSSYALGIKLSALHSDSFKREIALIGSLHREPTDREWAILRGHMHDSLNGIRAARRSSLAGLYGAALCCVVAAGLLGLAVWIVLSPVTLPTMMCPQAMP